MEKYIDKQASFTPEARYVILEQGTEHPHTGKFQEAQSDGSYLCRRCGLALFRAHHQFTSFCGWPSFDAELKHAIRERPDKDKERTEIICARCAGHLGHVFRNEQISPNNTRHCVNSLSIDFVESSTILYGEEIIVAGGCFWGVEHCMREFPGVVLAQSGYTGGHSDHPIYEEVCRGTTGHYEAVRVLYDKDQVEEAAVLKHFFEIHNPEEPNGQGPDIGPQYRSAVFVYNQAQNALIKDVLQRLNNHGYRPATKVLPVTTFWPAEEHHQRYFLKHPNAQGCHRYTKRFTP